MTLEPGALALLEATRRNLKDRVVPALSGPDRYEALLAISAIGIAIRELSNQSGRERSEAHALATLLDQTGIGPATDGNSIDSLQSRLADAISNGAFSDPDDTGALLDYLGAACSRTLALTNPGVARDYGPTGRRKPA